MDNVTCPFCGRGVNEFGFHEQGKTHELQCPLGGYTFTANQWQMRPPKKEQPINTIHLEQGEVAWLRYLVDVFILERSRE